MVVHNIASAEDFDKEIKGNSIVVVDCFATWCGPCKVIAPILAKLSDEFTNVKVLKIDVDELPDVAQANKVSAMPTFLFFKDGKPVDDSILQGGRIVGANPPALKAAMESLSKEAKA